MCGCGAQAAGYNSKTICRGSFWQPLLRMVKRDTDEEIKLHRLNNKGLVLAGLHRPRMG